MIELEIFGKKTKIVNSKSDNEFLNGLIDAFYTLEYQVSQGNAEICLAEHLSKMSMIKILNVDAADDGDQVY